MKRLGGTLAMLMAIAAPTHAQMPSKPHRVAVLSPARADLDARLVMPGIAGYGFVEGRDLTIEARTGAADDLPGLAHDLVASAPDVILAVSLPAVRAVIAATDAIPVVSVASADAVAAGWVDSLARPGRNITGVQILGPELDPKRLQLIHDLVPGVRHIAVLRDPAVAPEERRTAIEEAARDLGIAVEVVEARRVEDIGEAFRQARRLGASAVSILASPLFSGEASSVAAAAIAAKLPTMCHWREMVEAGCLASYGPPFAETFRLAGTQIGRLLAGARAADLPFEQPTRFELAINLVTAKALGLKVPPALLANADEVIE